MHRRKTTRRWQERNATHDAGDYAPQTLKRPQAHGPVPFSQKTAEELSTTLPVASVPHCVMRAVQGKYTEGPQSGGGRATLRRAIDAPLS